MEFFHKKLIYEVWEVTSPKLGISWSLENLFQTSEILKNLWGPLTESITKIKKSILHLFANQIENISNNCF